jgi:hypothetical protein
MHLLGPRCPASNQAHVHQRKLASQLGSSKPCRMASVPECAEGNDWPSPRSHSRQCYSRHLPVSPRLWVRLPRGKLGRWMSHRTRQLGFKKLLLSQSRNSTMHAIFDTCLKGFEFQVAFHAMLFSFLGAHVFLR